MPHPTFNSHSLLSTEPMMPWPGIASDTNYKLHRYNQNLLSTTNLLNGWSVEQCSGNFSKIKFPLRNSTGSDQYLTCAEIGHRLRRQSRHNSRRGSLTCAKCEKPISQCGGGGGSLKLYYTKSPPPPPPPWNSTTINMLVSPTPMIVATWVGFSANEMLSLTKWYLLTRSGAVTKPISSREGPLRGPYETRKLIYYYNYMLLRLLTSL